VERGGSDRGLRRALTKGLRRDLGRYHRGLLAFLRLLVKTLKGPLEKRLRQIEERLDRLDGGGR
jgi:hypothetical protein